MTDTQEPVELDGMELKKYVEFVVREVKKEKTHFVQSGSFGVFRLKRDLQPVLCRPAIHNT
jgi:hypothetical protein